jgi:hypothetical protein
MPGVSMLIVFYAECRNFVSYVVNMLNVVTPTSNI